MKLLLSWLQEFVSVPSEPRQLAEELTMLGLAVDSVTTEEGETVLEIDVTTNRPDCLSHYGIAREVAARYRLPLVPFPAAAPMTELARVRPRARRKDAMVEITATDLCARYSAR